MRAFFVAGIGIAGKKIAMFSPYAGIRTSLVVARGSTSSSMSFYRPA